MAREITIEILVEQGSRSQIHAQYSEAQREVAIDEAKVLSKDTGIDSVKVLREVYDTETGTSTETTLYRWSSKGSKTGGGFGAGAGAGGGGGSWSPPPSTMRADSDGDRGRGADKKDVDDEDDAPKRRRSRKVAKPVPPRKPSTAGGVVVKLLLVTLGAIAVATGATLVLAETLPHRTLFGVSLVGDSRANVLFIAFVIIFLGSSIPLARSLLSRIDLSAAPPAGAARRSPEKAVEKLKPSKDPEPPEKKKEAKAEEEDREKVKKKEKKPKEQAAAEEDTGMNFVEEEEKEDEKEDENEKEEELPVELSTEDEKQKIYMMKFLGDALQTVKSKQQKMDGVNKFGINLFLAGATEALSHEHNLGSETSSAILSDSVQVLGYKKAQADQFAAKADEYLVSDPKYMHMYEAGRNSMNTYLSGDAGDGAKGLVKALEDWNKPKSEDDTAGLLTVMFTDIAGSTAMTQELGDAGAQKVVRVHNRIVRQSLTAFGGKEIKHTGDGIMASFPSAANSVESCIDIQRLVEQHNKTDPSLPLHLKIGINAGEPIAEDDDLFGTTVQVAARITDGAKDDQIFVSEIVRGICVGKEFKFANRGAYEMKGLDQPITLFEVIWREDLTVEELTRQIAAEAEAAQAGPAPEAGKAKPVTPPPPAETPPAEAPPAQVAETAESKAS